jgi:hypothetical protein
MVRLVTDREARQDGRNWQQSAHLAGGNVLYRLDVGVAPNLPDIHPAQFSEAGFSLEKTMTLAEFKAWFEGFTEAMDGAPDEKQWARIKARVKEIDGVAVTKTVFVDHYYPPYRPYWSSQRLDVFGVCQNASGSAAVGKTYDVSGFNSQSAMLDLGKSEYSASLAS